MDVSKEHPVRLLDLNQNLLSEKDIQDKDLIKWTKEIIHTFTGKSKSFNNFKNTVSRRNYNLPPGAKLSTFGARHFVMKEQCALTDEEIEELRKEAKSPYSPYWYGMISTCHFSGHITLKIAQMLYPEVKWRLIITMGHTFVTNISDDAIVLLFSDISPYTKDIIKNFSSVYYPFGSNEQIKQTKEKKQKMLNALSHLMVDKASFDPSEPMIFDILVTNKDMFLGLTAGTPLRWIKINDKSVNEYRKSLIRNGNLHTVSLFQTARNYFYKKNQNRKKTRRNNK
jgi:hypothetical protein